MRRFRWVAFVGVVALVGAGVALAYHNVSTDDVTATFDITQRQQLRVRTCPGREGEQYVERTDFYRGVMHSDDPRLTGELRIVAVYIKDTVAGDGATVAKAEIRVPNTDRVKARGGYSAVLERTDQETIQLPGRRANDDFMEGYWVMRVAGAAPTTANQRQAPFPSGLLLANFSAETLDDGRLVLRDPSRDGNTENTADSDGGEGDTGELGQETGGEIRDDTPMGSSDAGETNDEDNPAIIQTSSCTHFDDWDDDFTD